jgi:hypothetical protein
MVILMLQLSGCAIELVGDAEASTALPPTAAQVAVPDDGCDRLLSTGSKLLEVGHGSAIKALASSERRVVARDARSWVLWDRTTGTQVARGPSGATTLDLVGDTMLTAASGRLEIRSAQDGALQQTITAPAGLREAKLSVDGGYVYALGDRVLVAWDRAGTKRVELALDDDRPAVFAAKDVLHIARSKPRKQIQSVSMETGQVRQGGEYQGDFKGWFIDGNHFVTLYSAFIVYDKDGKQVQTVPVRHPYRALPRAGGYGNHVWVSLLASGGRWAEVFRLGSSEPVLSLPSAELTEIPRSSAVKLDIDWRDTKLVDLRQDALPISEPVAAGHLAVDPVGGWVAAASGVIYDGSRRTADGLPSQLGCGAVRAMASWGERLAISFGGMTRVIRFRAGEPKLVWKAPGPDVSELAFMANGRVLIARQGSSVDAYEFGEEDQLVRSQRFDDTREGSDLVSVSTASGGTTFLLSRCRTGSQGSRCDAFVHALSEGRRWDILDFPSLSTPQMSPDGKRIAITEEMTGASAYTSIYDGWTQEARLPGLRVDLWLGDDRLLVSDAAHPDAFAKIVDRSGATHATLAAKLSSPVRKAADGLFHDLENVMRAEDGQVLWNLRSATGRTLAPGSPTALVRGRFVFVDDSAVVAEPIAHGGDAP